MNEFIRIYQKTKSIELCRAEYSKAVKGVMGDTTKHGNINKQWLEFLSYLDFDFKPTKDTYYERCARFLCITLAQFKSTFLRKAK